MKKIFLVISILFFAFAVSGCDFDKAAILFNRQPITKETVMNYSTVFTPGERIYYLILMPKTVESRYIYVQVIKKGEYDRYGYSLYRADTYKLKDEQMHYYDDYMVLNEKGSYIMKVYSKDSPQKVLTQAQFYVR